MAAWYSRARPSTQTTLGEPRAIHDTSHNTCAAALSSIAAAAQKFCPRHPHHTAGQLRASARAACKTSVCMRILDTAQTSRSGNNAQCVNESEPPTDVSSAVCEGEKQLATITRRRLFGPWPSSLSLVWPAAKMRALPCLSQS